MSWGWVSCGLFVNCQNKEQVNAVSNKFDRDILPGGTFSLWKPEREPLKIYIDLIDNEVSFDFDEEVIALFDWFRENFSLSVEGAWFFEGDNGHWRSEVKDGKVIDAYLDWLSEYTVEQINELRKHAEEKYKANVKDKSSSSQFYTAG